MIFDPLSPGVAQTSAPVSPQIAPQVSPHPATPGEAFRRSGLSTPAYVLDHAAFHHNGRILTSVQQRTGAKILLAQKAFACFNLYPTLRNYLAGTAASGLYEARLGAEEFGGEVHVFSPAFKEPEMDELLRISDHLVFNSLGQWERFKPAVLSAPRSVSPGLRINPEHAESVAEIYNPCAPGSRFGVLADQLDRADLSGIEGLHFHTLCEQGADALERTLAVVMEKFDHHLRTMSWLNMGGGHLVTSPDYDVERLVRVLREVSERYPHLQLYLEPGEAIATGGGVLVGSVIDIVHNGMDVAVLDVSATAHMPDVLEMPYRPDVVGAGKPGEKKHTYRFGGPTCLSGDVIGDYSFDTPLRVGDQVVFTEMAYYTIVKNTLFNGIPLPSLCILQEDGEIELVREFGYDDYKSRLG